MRKKWRIIDRKPFVIAIQLPDVLNSMEKLIRNDAMENLTLMYVCENLFYFIQPSFDIIQDEEISFE